MADGLARALGAEAHQINIRQAAEWLAEAKDVLEILEFRDFAQAAKAYWESRGDSLNALQDAAECCVLSEAKLGEAIKQAKDAGLLLTHRPPGSVDADDTFTLEDFGASRDQSSRWQKLAEMRASGTLREYLDTCRAKEVKISTSGALKAVSDGAEYSPNEWYTPQRYIDAARQVLGEIDLDPASNPIAQKTVRAKKFLTKEDDGRTRKWAGSVWMNPPYSMPEVADLTNKFADHFRARDIEAGIILVNNNTDSDWCQRLLGDSSAYCFTDGRIAFLQPDGTESKQTRRGQVFFYFGPNPDVFADVFCQFGFVGVSFSDKG